MTKEIIIDGVDVAGCKYYDDETCCNNDVFTLSCEKANCMYKQLKRLEQENENLKQQLEIDKNQINYFIEENLRINKYKQTLQEIKEIAENYLTACQGFKCDAMEEILQKITKAEEE